MALPRTLSVVLLICTSVVTSLDLEKIVDKNSECWKKYNGVCVVNSDPCPFKDGKEVTRFRRSVNQGLCSDNQHRCCVPPQKETVHTYRDSRCGLAAEVDPRFRVHGGIRSLPGEIPWQVSIRSYRMSHHCGGTLIHPKWVLTAAHCFALNDNDVGDLNDWSVVLGDLNMTHVEGTEQEYGLKQIINHPEFNNPDYSNDIALLELEEEVKLTKYVNYVCMPNIDEDMENMVCTVSGFGATESRWLSQVLLKVQKPVVPLEECQKAHCKYQNPVYSTNMCAGFQAGKRDACSGDSGGPFTCRKVDKLGNKRWVIAGVVSHGQECGLEETPGVYTRVTDYLDWIEHTTNIRFFNGSFLTPAGQEPKPFPVKEVTRPYKCSDSD